VGKYRLAGALAGYEWRPIRRLLPVLGLALAVSLLPVAAAAQSAPIPNEYVQCAVGYAAGPEQVVVTVGTPNGQALIGEAGSFCTQAIADGSWQAANKYVDWRAVGYQLVCLAAFNPVESIDVYSLGDLSSDIVAYRTCSLAEQAGATVQYGPSPSPPPTDTPSPPPTEPPATAAPVPTKPATPSVEFVSVQGGRPGQRASVTVSTAPGAQCSLDYQTPAGTSSTAQGLGPKSADATGMVSWTWLIGGNTRPGTGSVSVACGGTRATSPIQIG
jgi:hypothetical protein